MEVCGVKKGIRSSKGHMMRVCVCFVATAFVCGSALGQSAEKPQFEVADVHISPQTSQPFTRGPFYTSGRYELRFATMLDMIATAYAIDPERVSGGPNWLEMDRFDVFAKTPEKSTAESRKLMLQSLLAERFKLAIHNDTRPMAAYGLTAKKPQLKDAEGEGETGCKFTAQNASNAPTPGGGPIQLPVLIYACKNMTMAAFAGALLNAPAAGQYLNNRLVVDQTELKGSYDFTLRYTPKIPAGFATTGEQIPLFDALEKQLGLKLELTTSPMPTMVVDSVNQKPTANSPEAMKSFPPLPTEFEVASLKPSAPDARPGPPDVKNGRLYLPGISLQNLILIAWDVNTPEFLVGAPKWLNEDKYEILAKAPAGVAIGDLTPNRNAVPVNIDALRPMMRALITERFQMAAHTEDRPMNAYTLTANKPKLKKADPTSRTRWQEGVAPDSKGDKNANASLGRLVTCQNVSMAQFAVMLPNIAPGYLATNVVDATGLEGGYDFTFSFSPLGAVRQARAATGETSDASEPSGTLTLFEAISKQLGLKLDTVKRPVQVLVIDKIERKPLEN
jgi:uncharacterized protein (TIGR03435 family)